MRRVRVRVHFSELVLFGVIDAEGRVEHVCDSDLPFVSVLFEQFDGTRVGDINMVRRLEVTFDVAFDAWRVCPSQVAERAEDDRFIERDPVTDTVAERLETRIGETDECVNRLFVLPTACFFECLWEVPVVECDEWDDVVLQALVDQVVVKLESFFVHFACAVREDTRPRDGEAIGFESHLCHKCDIFFITVVMVDGDVAVRIFKRFSRNFREDVPVRESFPVLVPCAFDLVRSRRCAEQEIFRHFQSGHLNWIICSQVSWRDRILSLRSSCRSRLC